jgi:hypothetical protein
MKTKIEIFFYYVTEDDDKSQIVEHVRRRSISVDKKKTSLTYERLLYLLKNNNELGYSLDEIWNYDNKTRKFDKINSNSDITYYRKHFANRLCIFYKQKSQTPRDQTRKIKYQTKSRSNNKTKKNIHIQVKLL